MRTAATFTLNTVSTAFRISILFASGCTSKHSVRFLFALVVPFFGDNRAADHVVYVHYASASESFLAAGSVSSTCLMRSRS